MSRLRTGDLRHPVVIEWPLETPADDGEMEVAIWAVYAEPRMAIEPLSGTESFGAQHEESKATHTGRCRYVAGVTPVMRVVYGARVFDIESALNVEERSRELEILMVEKTDN